MLKIRKHLPKDIPYRVLWLNDPKVNKLISDGEPRKTTLAKEKKWYTEYRKQDNKRYFTICDDAKPIGYMGLSHISKVNKKADLFILIGDVDYCGKGIAKQSLLWLIDYGFQKLKLHKIALSVYEDNLPAVHLYKSAGFTVEGKIMDDAYFGGRYHNSLYMAKFHK